MKQLFQKAGVKVALWVLITVLVLIVAAVLIVNLIVCMRAKKHIISMEQLRESGETYDCILVLGAGVWNGDTPSHMLEDRLKVGIEAYFAGASTRFLMSGDHMQKDYDEVGVMKRYAMEAGIPGEVIFLDHAGLSTYESVWRAKEIYGAKKILIVTQEYHLYRSIYLASRLGIEADGVSADLRTYRNQTMCDIREAVARVKDFVYAMWKPLPSVVGDPVDLAGDGNLTNDNPLLEQ